MCGWVYVSGSKAPLVRPVGLFGRGLSVDLPLLLLDSDASENEAPSDFFTFFFLLDLWGETIVHRQYSLVLNHRRVSHKPV